MFQVQDHSLRPLTTAHLAQTMSLLVLSNQELRSKVLEEMSSNPALELVEQRACPACHRPMQTAGPCPNCSRPRGPGDPIVFLSTRASMPRAYSGHSGEAPPDLEPAAPEDLATHVMEQLAPYLQPAERNLVAYILDSLDEEGFLQDQAAQIARTTRSTLAEVERALHLISHVEPAGLATTGPRGALLAQIDQLEKADPIAKLAGTILREAFGELASRNYEAIAHSIGSSPAKVRLAIEFLQDNLNPYPARAFWGSGRNPQPGDPNVYHTPDVMISINPLDEEGPLMAEIFAPISGWLRVNPLFRQSAPDADEPHSEEWTRHLERAALFVKCLQQRNNTMKRLMEILVATQRDFIINGDRHLKPITRAAIADEIGVHESTISRAVAAKSVAFPDGRITPLDRFFDRSLSVRDRLKEIVKNERRPLTDDEIAGLLAREGVAVARRTIAKYRAIEGILPARLRHRQPIRDAAWASSP
ncbi:MAG TPA: hypothetical protein VJ123_07775 [Anaerolineales bacterium]|nr:hypothetical protein [Anaerolineales bacterium]